MLNNYVFPLNIEMAIFSGIWFCCYRTFAAENICFLVNLFKTSLSITCLKLSLNSKLVEKSVLE